MCKRLPWLPARKGRQSQVRLLHDATACVGEGRAEAPGFTAWLKMPAAFCLGRQQIPPLWQCTPLTPWIMAALLPVATAVLLLPFSTRAEPPLMAMALFPLPGAKTTAELGSSELLPTATATLGGVPGGLAWANALAVPWCFVSPLIETVAPCTSVGAAHAAGAAATPSASSGAPALTAMKDFFNEIVPFLVMPSRGGISSRLPSVC